ncbi:60Kd inner membrane protein-domain-containing protein [Corynascus novoguineensis]|uniref:60Kd inner membrane protein-domain-containing protein n=1 Tax=Corynascus novoguineensis TaxID=1126955 RepID=A0AAN7HMQ1_9PEZI|nr:60Kd inner membrane protein-domain-containing protein [Corynascus novoguineensis]
MATDEPPNPMAESGVTIRSDSEQYSRHEEQSVSPPSSPSPAVILYQPPTIWSIIRGAAINLFLPFVNGMMLGFGELFAHEAAFRLGWSNTRASKVRSRDPPKTFENGRSGTRKFWPPSPFESGVGICQGTLNNNVTALRGRGTAKRIGSALPLVAASQPLLFSRRQARNASTQSTTATPTSTPDASNLSDLTGTPVNLTGSDLLDIPEQIGFLKTLGLEYGWGPTSFMQTILEHVYVYTGLPWWASIAVVAVGIRLALLKPALDASENSIKYQELLKDPRYQAATEEMKRVLVTGNHLAGAQARAKITLMNKAAGYSLWKNFVPMIQLPIGIGMFRLIKGMSALPVPSFETGGLLWFTDLTASDPLFILPIATGIVVAMGLRIPLPYMAAQQRKMMKIMSLVVMPLSTVVALFLPSGLTWYFFLSSLLHTVQAFFMHQPWFRRLVGLRPLTAPAPSSSGPMGWQAPRVVDARAPRVAQAQSVASAPAPESMFGSIKSTLEDAKEKLNERSNKDAVDRALKAAREYEEKRALEEKEKILARLHQKRAKGERF